MEIHRRNKMQTLYLIELLYTWVSVFEMHEWTSLCTEDEAHLSMAKPYRKNLDRSQFSLLYKNKAMEKTPANVLLAYISIILNMEMPFCLYRSFRVQTRNDTMLRQVSGCETKRWCIQILKYKKNLHLPCLLVYNTQQQQQNDEEKEEKR